MMNDQVENDMSDKPEVAKEFADVLVGLLESRGIKRADFFLEAGIKPGFFENSDATLSLVLYEKMLTTAIRLTRDPAIGLPFGLLMVRPAFHFLVNAVDKQLAPGEKISLGDALEVIAKYFKRQLNFLELRLFVQNQDAVLQLEERMAPGGLLRFFVESLFICLHGTVLNLISDPGISGEVRVSFACSEGEDVLEKILGRQVLYESAVNQLRFPAQNLQLKLDLSSLDLNRIALEQSNKLHPRLQNEHDLIKKIKQILLDDIEHDSNLESVASLLHFSSRTLKRRLKELDTSFQKILDGVRKGLAIEYLMQTNKNIEEIAGLLGYSDPSNFGRAFKKWTGKSPSEYRK